MSSKSQNEGYIQQAIYWVLYKNAFVGNLLQELTIRPCSDFPTAALSYNKEQAKFEIIVNDEFFKSLSVDERVAVLFHEILHFTHGHIFRFEQVGKSSEQILKNIAADIAINQYIQNLPKNCVKVEDFKDENGNPFPTFQTFEVYFDLLKKTSNDPNQGEGEEDGQDGTQDTNGKGQGKPKPGSSINWDKVKGFKEFDKHDWDKMDTAEKQRMLQEAKTVVQRSIEKAFRDYSQAPEGIKELLKKIDAEIKALNYRGLLKYAIKKTLSTNNRQSSWYRPNKRYGNYAPGTTVARQPQLNFYVDMSGSISIKEANEFLEVMNGFLGAGGYRNCNLGFWHTELYQFRKYKPKTELKSEDMQSGGTEPLCVLNHIQETHPNLSIILTDGHYSGSKIELTDKVIWIISKGGNVNHPYKHLGMTVKMEEI